MRQGRYSYLTEGSNPSLPTLLYRKDFNMRRIAQWTLGISLLFILVGLIMLMYQGSWTPTQTGAIIFATITAIVSWCSYLTADFIDEG
jgi:hypothetical protein|tara:strand:+ start:267 stop:530 length:264 start_codon:yes stop_codon:yes gene_type:complete